MDPLTPDCHEWESEPTRTHWAGRMPPNGVATLIAQGDEDEFEDDDYFDDEEDEGLEDDLFDDDDEDDLFDDDKDDDGDEEFVEDDDD